MRPEKTMYADATAGDVTQQSYFGFARRAKIYSPRPAWCLTDQ